MKKLNKIKSGPIINDIFILFLFIFSILYASKNGSIIVIFTPSILCSIMLIRHPSNNTKRNKDKNKEKIKNCEYNFEPYIKKIKTYIGKFT